MRAKKVIEQEHRSLAAVLHGMLYVMREIRYGGARADFALLDAMLHYIETFSERFHHPKEETHLFNRLAMRWPAAAPLLERLREEHAVGHGKLQSLRSALARYRTEGDAAFPDFATQVAGYAAFHWHHMRFEEDELMPLAVTHLTSEDWDAIDQAFLGHTDPLLGVERGAEYQALFELIVDLAPSPIGRAPAR